MKKLFILTLALLISTWAYAAVPDLTPQNVTLQNPNFKTTGLTGWTVEGPWSDKSESSAPDGNYIRIMSDANPPTMISQKVVGIGAGTYVLTAKGGVSRNSWGGNIDTVGKGKMYGCIYVTDNPEEAGDINAPGCTKIGETGGTWTDFMTMFSTMENNPELEIGFGIPASSDGIPKLNIRVDMFELRYFPTMDQEAVKAYLDGTDYTMVQSISLDVTSKTVDNKDLFTLTATIEPADYSSTEKGVIWSSSNEDVATVDEDGVVTPAGAGTCDIIATSKADPMISAKCELTVEIPEVQVSKVTVAIDGIQDENRVEETKTLQLLVNVEPDDATNKRVTWSSSDTTIATVDENGLVTGVKAGTVTITATSEMVNTVNGAIELTVYKNAVTEITLSQETAEIEQGKTLQLTATVEPENATYPEIKWSSSDVSIASVDEATGLVTGNSAGTVDIIATADGVSSTCKVTVKHIEVEDVTLNATAEKIVVGATFNLIATVTPSNATDPSVKWSSSNESVATVSESGVVTGTGIGTAIITATAGSESSTCSFEVLAAVELQSETLNTITNPLFDNSTWNNGWSNSNTWTVKTESKNQDWGGKSYARLYSGTLSPGESGDFITQTITLEKAGVYTLSAYTRASRNHSGGLTEDQFGLLFINEGENIPNEYEGLNCAKTRTSGWEWVYKSVVIATNEPNTKVTFGYGLPKECPSISQGNLECSDFVLNYYPTTLDANAVNACINKLVYTPVKSIELPESLALIADKSETLTAKVSPEDANNTEVVWTSSDETIATVDQTGKVTATNKGGEAKITATSAADAMIKAECTVTVTVPVPATGLELQDKDNNILANGTTLNLTEGDTYTIKAVVKPENSTDKVTWKSSNVEVAKVDANGNITTIKVGKTTVTATAGEISSTINVEVAEAPIPITGITLNKSTADMKTGATLQLTATIEPEDATSKNVSWSSDKEDIATVNENGEVTAVKAGNVTITASAGNCSASCTITITDIEVTSITLEKTATLVIGESVKLTATVAPEDATDKTVTWTSSNPYVAEVDQQGNVKAIATGETVISAKAGDKIAECKVTVIVPIESITLNFKELTVEKDDEFSIGYTISPEDASNVTVTWTSSDEKIATVDVNGKVKALADGETTITAKAGNKEATCKITVVTTEAVDGVKVRMTYVDMDNPATPIGLIKKGESARSGYNKISGGSVDFVNTGWGENKITYIQVDASAITDESITSATLTFEASGASDSKRETIWGVGYNSSAWSSLMTYKSADKSITTIGGTQQTVTKAAGTFETFSFDITDAINNAEGRVATIIVYETAAAGGYIKNPVVTIESTDAPVYKVTFSETNEVEGVKVIVNDRDVTTNGILLPDGTYTLTATAPNYKNYSKEFIVDGEDLNVEFTMTKKELWNYSVKNSVNGKIINEGTVYEGEKATVAYNRYILNEGKVYVHEPGKQSPYTITFTPETDGHVETVTYTEYAQNAIYFIEAENINGMTPTTNGNAGARASNAKGGFAKEAVKVHPLQPGTYKVEIAASGDKDKTLKVTVGNNVFEYKTTGSWGQSKFAEFTIETPTDIIFEGADEKYPLDYVLITGKSEIKVESIVIATDDIAEEYTINDKVSLTATVTSNSTLAVPLAWNSSNPSVATVDDSGNVEFVGPGKVEIEASYEDTKATCTLVCYPQLGDATWDGSIDITDAVEISNYVVGKTRVKEGWNKDEWTKFYTRGANANKSEDGKITFADASAAVKLALTEDPDTPTQSRIIAAYDNDDQDALVIGGISAANGRYSIPVTLDNSMEYVALQADIILPEGMNVEVKEGSRVAGSHIMATHKFADNHIRVALYNLGNTAFAENNAPIIEIIADGMISDNEEIAIFNIIAADTDANRFVLASKAAETTGVAALGFDNDAPVKVYDLNGRYISDKVEGLEQGFFIIRQGNNAKKVRIR